MPWISSWTLGSSASAAGSSEQPVLLGEVHDLLGVERDQRDRVGPAVAVHHGLGDPARLLEVVLDVGRREVLAARGDDDVLLAAGDEEEAVLVERAEVARVQPAVDDRAEARVVVLVVAAEDVRALDQDLAVVGDPDLAARAAACRPSRAGGARPSRWWRPWRSRSCRSPPSPARRRRRRTRGSPCAIGAAPVLACLSRPPNTARTFLNSASSAAS